MPFLDPPLRVQNLKKQTLFGGASAGTKFYGSTPGGRILLITILYDIVLLKQIATTEKEYKLQH